MELNDFEEQLQEHITTSCSNSGCTHFPDDNCGAVQGAGRDPWKIIRSPRMTGAREKWPAHVEADEMFLRTSTEYAPCTIIPAEDKNKKLDAY